MSKETMQFQFMNQFQKRLQQHDDPIQWGYDDGKDFEEKLVHDGNEKVRVEMIT